MREPLLILTILFILISLTGLSFADCPLTACTDDLSGDGITDSWDITYLTRAITGISGYDKAASGDVSGDGMIDAWDCMYLARAIVGVLGYEI